MLSIKCKGFQFLMVQLKEFNPVRKRRGSYISIPNGSIKRMWNLKYDKEELRFQFLMVQLKANLCYPFAQSPADFNS